MCERTCQFALTANHTNPCNIEMHLHPCYELVFYCNGTGTITLNGSDNHYNAGSVMLIYPNQPHDEKNYESVKTIFLGFESGNIPLTQGLYQSNEKIYRLFCEIVSEQKKRQQNYQNKMAALLCNLENELFRFNFTGNWNSDLNFEYIQKFISENYSQPIKTAALAWDCGYSTDRFRHIFKEKYGITPKQLAINMRLSNAAYLLEKSNYSITEIAVLSGFYDSSQFSKMFFRRYNITPQKYRLFTQQ